MPDELTRLTAVIDEVAAMILLLVLGIIIGWFARTSWGLKPPATTTVVVPPGATDVTITVIPGGGGGR